ncbi:hypothetical protein [Paraliobacillus sp. JSM ZJ581]
MKLFEDRERITCVLYFYAIDVDIILIEEENVVMDKVKRLYT